ncbi:hypothetical protein M569_08074 [Genlisea aurea]|uniref:Topo IIA-type catalytic domain-containing protein n=1 Tax=Genlisea aurea TaxID=192259 RepID=S8CPC7_9LAMI|nr:hypothetical protein M569_08074 [Genlisea aurea]
MSFATSFRFLRCHSLSLTVVAHRRCLQGTRTAELRFLTQVEALQQRRLFSLSASSKKIEEGNGAVASVRGENGGDGDDGTHDAIIDFELPKEATDGYMQYAMSVLLGRALPDFRDGLKPVHRRIL